MWEHMKQWKVVIQNEFLDKVEGPRDYLGVAKTRDCGKEKARRLAGELKG
jgi:hypothetical protein